MDQNTTPGSSSRPLRRVAYREILQAMRTRGYWSGYVAGAQVAPRKVRDYGQRIHVSTAQGLREVAALARRDLDPDTGYRLAYYAEE